METINNSVLALLYEHRYIFSFLGALFEGTFIMILAGVFLKLGYLKFWGIISVLVSGYFINGIFFYLIGRYGGERALRKLEKFKRVKGILGKLQDYFLKHSIKTIFITRITYGLSIPTLLMAGSFKMNFKKFLIITFWGAVVWALMLIGVGYVFGASYKAMGIVVKSISVGLSVIAVVLLVIISIGIVVWARTFARTEFIERLSVHKNSQILRWLGIAIKKLARKKDL